MRSEPRDNGRGQEEAERWEVRREGEGLGGISEGRVPAVASAADKFCKIKMKKYQQWITESISGIFSHIHICPIYSLLY